MRAQVEAGNVTWDLVDAEGPDFAAPLRRGLGGRDRLRHRPRPRRRRLDPDRGFRRQPDQRLLHPADRVLHHLRLPHRRARVGGPRARGPLRALRPGELPRQAQPGEAAEEEPRVGAALRRRGQGGPLRRARRGRGRPGARQARHHQGPGGLVVGRRRDAAAARRRRGGDGLDLQRPPLLGDRGAEAAGEDALGLAGLRLRRLDRARRPARGPDEPGDALPALRHRHPAAGGPGQVHLLRPGARLVAAAGRQARRSRHRHGAAHADQPGQPEELSSSTTSSGGRTTRTRWTPASRSG